MEDDYVLDDTQFYDGPSGDEGRPFLGTRVPDNLPGNLTPFLRAVLGDLALRQAVAAALFDPAPDPRPTAAELAEAAAEDARDAALFAEMEARWVANGRPSWGEAAGR